MVLRISSIPTCGYFSLILLSNVSNKVARYRSSRFKLVSEDVGVYIRKNIEYKL